MLLWSGARCWTRTKAMPGSVSAGMPEKKASKAASPPAEAPMPTMGKPEPASGDRSLQSINSRAGSCPPLPWAFADEFAICVGSSLSVPIVFPPPPGDALNIFSNHQGQKTKPPVHPKKRQGGSGCSLHCLKSKMYTSSGYTRRINHMGFVSKQFPLNLASQFLKSNQNHHHLCSQWAVYNS